jgi:hypothetical protein
LKAEGLRVWAIELIATGDGRAASVSPSLKDHQSFPRPNEGRTELAALKFEELRAEWLRQLDQEARDLDMKLAQANAEKALIDSETARIKNGAPAGDFCPECWLHDGVIHPMVLIAGDNPSPRIETFRCNGCRYEEARNV